MPDDISDADTVSLPFCRLTTASFTLTAAPCIIRAADYRELLTSRTLRTETEQLRQKMQAALTEELENTRRKAQADLAAEQAHALLQTRRHCREVITRLDDEITALICHTVHILLEETPPENRLRAALRRSAGRIKTGAALSLVVHPDQADFLHQWLSSEGALPLPDDISVDTDRTLLPGDCLICQGREIIHATLENQLAVLREICQG